MFPFILFKALFAEFGRALAAARRYDSLKFTHAGHGKSTAADIPRHIFEEFYAPQGNAEHAARASDRRRSLHPRFGL